MIRPNGAGKTTLFALITGFQAPTDGRIVYNGANVTGMLAHRLARWGMARTFQIVQPFAGLTVLKTSRSAPICISRTRAALAAAGEVAKLVGLERVLQQSAATLTVAGRKRLNLPGHWRRRRCCCSMKSWPASTVGNYDMVPIIRAIRERGVTIMMIEHVMQVVMSLAEHIYVLVEGHVIAQGPPAAIVADSRVIEAYLGAGAAARLAGGAHGR